MTQTDKIIKVIIVAVAIAGGIFLTNAYYPEIKAHGKKVSNCKDSIQGYKKNLRNLSPHAWHMKPSILQDIKYLEKDIKQHSQKQAIKTAILIFGNIGIILCAIGINHFLTSGRRLG